MEYKEDETIESPHIKTEYSIEAVLESIGEPSKALMSYRKCLIIDP